MAEQLSAIFVTAALLLALPLILLGREEIRRARADERRRQNLLTRRVRKRMRQALRGMDGLRADHD